MSGVLVVAGRELKERWKVLVAALLAGLLAIVVPLFASLGRHDARDARELAALVFAVALSCGIAAIVGAGVITRDLVERRAGFYFVRPLSGGAIWAGKVLACWLLAVASGLVVLLPAVAISGTVCPFHATAFYMDTGAGLAGAAATILLLVLVAHVGALMVRSHTPWLLALDALFGIGVIVTVALALRSLVLASAREAATRGGAAFSAALFVGLCVAGFAQVSLGRTDFHRGHRVLSLTLWGTLGSAALILAGYARWVRAVDVSDLAYLDEVVGAPKGDWAFIEGRAWGRGDYVPTFLLDTRSGRAVSLRSAPIWWFRCDFSDDGTRAVWPSSTASLDDSTYDVSTLDLTDPTSTPVTTRISFSREPLTVLKLSPDGRRLALGDDKTLSVVELLAGRLLLSVRVPEDLGGLTVLWTSADRLYLVGWPPRTAKADPADMRLFELDVSRHTLLETGRIPGVLRVVRFLLFDRKTGHLVTIAGAASHHSLVLCDVRTGARIATLAASTPLRRCRAMILADGTIAVGEAGDAGVRLRLFSTTGALQRTIPVGPGRALFFGAQPTPSTLVIATRPQAERSPTETRADLKSYVVDVVTGTVTTLGAGYSPRSWAGWLGSSTVPTPGSAATRAFIDPGGHFVILDPATNTFRAVLSARWYTN